MSWFGRRVSPPSPAAPAQPFRVTGRDAAQPQHKVWQQRPRRGAAVRRVGRGRGQRSKIRSDAGADGIAFTVLDTTRTNGEHITGGTGEGLGSSGLPGYTIEFDTFQNNGFDQVTEDHVAMWFDGVGHTNGANAVEHGIRVTEDFSAGANLEDGGWHAVEITVGRPNNGDVIVTIDGVNRLVHHVPEEDRSWMTFAASCGWTASTGDEHN
eukprot:gene57967-biopygen89926